MTTCVSGKKVFLTQQSAEDALIETWGRNNYALNTGPVLAKEIASGRIKLQREASHWDNKLKKK